MLSAILAVHAPPPRCCPPAASSHLAPLRPCQCQSPCSVPQQQPSALPSRRCRVVSCRARDLVCLLSAGCGRVEATRRSARPAPPPLIVAEPAKGQIGRSQKLLRSRTPSKRRLLRGDSRSHRGMQRGGQQTECTRSQGGRSPPARAASDDKRRWMGYSRMVPM